MKTIKRGTVPTLPVLLGLIIILIAAIFPETAGAADIESYRFIDRLLSLPGPGAPEVFEDMVIFTAPSGYRRVGIAFANEDFSRVYWFRQLLIPQDPLDAPLPPGKREPDPYKDSGLLFYVYQLPEDIRELDYRLVINGLWTIDPANPVSRKDGVSGLVYSSLSLPARESVPGPLRGPPGSLSFYFKGPPGEIVTVGGSFNGWDPFMYELREGPAGVYTSNIPLPPGRYQYVFFHRGERFLDPYNPKRAYSQDGRAVSEIEIR
ncbi:MAG: glycogen-binding domain-containing protein [Treponema sp.]|jgi:hypothetical protein|nr:glycogen-binding domain-containing protein [Treponema sp.]